MADVNIGLTGAGEKALPLTQDNVLKAVEGVKNWENLCGTYGFGVWDTDIIRRQHDSDEAYLKAVVEKFLLGEGSYHPSWRVVIYSLDRANEVQLADKIRSFGEPVQDPTLTTDNVTQVMVLVNDWDSLSSDLIRTYIVIPSSRLRAIQQKFSTKIEISTECASYYVHCHPESSWTHLANCLYDKEEFAAGEKLKSFLPLRDPTLTTNNVAQVMVLVNHWDSLLGGVIPDIIPFSQLSAIQEKFSTKREISIECASHYVHCNPESSWTHLASRLYEKGEFAAVEKLKPFLLLRDYLSISDLPAVFKELYDVRSKWFNFGLELKINPNDLDAIKLKYRDDPEECFKDSLSMWLKNKDPRPTWDTLVGALKSPNVGLQQLSSEVQKNHLPRASASHATLVETFKPQQSQRDIVSESFQCPCGNCDLLSYLDEGCPKNSLHSYPYFQLSKLSEEDSEDLIQKLSDNTANIIKCFADLLSTTVASLVKKVTITTLIQVVLDLKRHESGSNLQPLLPDDLMKATSINEVFILLRNYISFFNHELFGNIVRYLGDDNDKKEYETYCYKFKIYCERRMFEVSSREFNASDSGKCVRNFCFIGTQYLFDSLVDVKKAHRKIAVLLGLRSSTVKLMRIDVGGTPPKRMFGIHKESQARAQDTHHQDLLSPITPEGKATFKTFESSQEDSKEFKMSTQTSHKDESIFNEKDGEKIAANKTPIPASHSFRESLEAYLTEVVVMLHTVKEEEKLAVLNHLSPPVKQSTKAILWFDGNISLTLGIFGDHKAALIQTSKGVNCLFEILPALQSLPSVKLIIALGFAYGLKSKCNLGDVLVSTHIDGVESIRFEHNRLNFDESCVEHTSMSTAALNVFAKGTLQWKPFKCSKAGRTTKVISGPLISSPMLLDNQYALDEFLKNNDKFKGGEMEGQELARSQLSLKQHDRDVDFIVIKGVADFGDGTKEKGWQLTASLAAASYAEKKLRDSAGKVYYCSVEEEAMHNRKDLVSIVRRNDFDTAQKILDTQEIDVNAKESDKDGHEWTPLMWAVYNENLKMVELLLRKRANPNEVAKDSNWTSLMFASLKGDLNIAKALLDGGADANAQTIEGVTALAIAIYEHKTEIARLLIDKGAGVHLPDNNGWSPLIYASSYGNLVLVKLICDEGANVCYQTKMGWSSLTLAVAHGHTSVAKELARRGADLNVLSNTGDAALHLAAGLNYPNIVKELVASGANMEIINKEGMTALMLAAHAGYLDVVEILLQNGANVNGQHKTTGWTAIFIAVWKGKVNIFKRLRHEATVDLKGGLNLLDVAIYYNQVVIITELKVQGLVKLEKSVEKIIDATRILQSHFHTLEDRYSKLLDNPSKQGNSKLRESPSAENLQESQNVQNNELIAAVEEAIQRKGTIEHTIIHGMFVGPARSGKDTLIKRLLNEKVSDTNSPSTGIAESAMSIHIECVTANVNETTSSWTRMKFDEEAVDLMIKTSNTFQPDISTESEDTTEPDESNDTAESEDHVLLNTNIPKDEGMKTQFKDDTPQNNDKSSPSFSNIPDYESSLSSFKDLIRNKGMTGIREHYERSWSLYLTNTGGQGEFQEVLPLLISGPSIFFVTFPLHIGLKDKLCIEYQPPNHDNPIKLYTTTLIECILQTLATVVAMGTTKSTTKTGEQKYQHKSKVFLVGTHKDELGDSADSEDIKEKIEVIDQLLWKEIKAISHFVDGLIEPSSDNQKIFTVNNLSDDESDFIKLRSAVECCIKMNVTFTRKYPAHWLIFSLVLRMKTPQKIVTYSDCYSIAQSCGIKDEKEFTKALEFIHSTMGVIRYFPYEQDGLKDIVIIDPQILFDLVTDLIVNTFTSQHGVTLKECGEFKNKGIFSSHELDKVTSKRGFNELLPLKRFATLLTILRMAAPFTDTQGLKKYFLPCALCHADDSTDEDCCISTNLPPLLVTFECKYCPMGIAGALIKYLITNEMESKLKWELLRDKIFRNEVCLRVGPYDNVRVRFTPTFIEIAMLETEVTERDSYPQELACCEVQEAVERGIRKISDDMKYSSADPSMTFYCNLKRCLNHRHPGAPERLENILKSLACHRHGSTANLPHGYKMWCLDKRKEQQSSISEQTDSTNIEESERCKKHAHPESEDALPPSKQIKLDERGEGSMTRENPESVDALPPSKQIKLDERGEGSMTRENPEPEDEPKFNEEECVQIIRTKKPIPAPCDLSVSLRAYLSEVVILLHTVKEEEWLAALKHLSPPLKQRDKAINWYDKNILLTLGIFGDHKAALIQTSKGVDCQHQILPALKYLSNVRLIVGLGFAYGLKSKCKLGDLLVSTHVDGVGNCRIEHNRLKFDEGRVRQTSMSTDALNVFTKHTSLWRSFECSKAGRLTVAVAGPLISSPMLLNDSAALDNFLKNNERFKGGEMEGQELARAQLTLKEQDRREIDFIVIKGVADFGDGSKQKAWQLTASLAAASYAEEKLLESGGNVYKCSMAEAATPYVSVARAEGSSRTPFFLKFIDGNITKCNGCNRKFKPYNREPVPPNDLIVKHLENISYYNKSSGMATKRGNAYYHLNMNCIRAVHSNIGPSNFAISDSERSKLTDAHKDKLKTLGMTIE